MTGSKSSTPGPNRPIRKFNPGTHQSDEQVIGQFVVRNRELKTILEVLRGNVDSPSCQHIILVGPRGRGKTMLLVRSAAELRTDEQLSGRLLPVRFMEESQEIFNLADFWLEALFHLAREIEEHDSDLSRQLRETHAGLSSRWREQSLEALARAAVLEAADRLNRRLVLMVENLQSLCENVDEDFGWKLREALQTEPQVMLLASATSRFEGLNEAEQPFFELFRNISLQPLDTDECRLLWQVVSGDNVSTREIRPLQILTGGNPRLLVIVAEFARHRSLRRLMEELVTLIDEHTEYFRGHLEVLAKTERRVYVSVIDLWQPSSTGEIAARARADVRVVSTMLGRLVERGAVVVEGTGRKRLYAPAEPIYSIYYKLRRERDEAAIVENLIHFMVAFYDDGEISEISEQLYLEARESQVLRAGMNRALEKMKPADEVGSSAKRDMVKDAGDRLDRYYQAKSEKRLQEKIDRAFNEGAWRSVIEIAAKLLTAGEAESLQHSVVFLARIFQMKAFAYLQLGELRAMEFTCEEMVRICHDSNALDVQWRVASVLLELGRSTRESGDLQGAIAAYEEVVKHYGASTTPELQWWVAVALNHKGKAIKERGDLEGAIASWDELIERYRASRASNIQYWVAAALISKAEATMKLGDAAGADAIVKSIIERYSYSSNADLQYWVGAALIDKGRMETQIGDLNGAVATYEQVVERFGASDVSGLQMCVAGALIDIGRVKTVLGDSQGAVAAWDELVQRYSGSDASDLQRFVIGALIDKGMFQAEMGRADEALRLCEDLEKRVCALPGDGNGQFAWQMLCIRALALTVRHEKVAAMNVFCSVYAGFPPDDDVAMKVMLRFVPNLVAAGAPERELVALLNSDPTKSLALAPLIVALRERQGETVRAPSEVREAAADVRKKINDRLRSWPETAAISPP
ncbi:MAG: AAA family ATPase [Gemmatimonadota bacterium]|nr:AAA family ATPase [Gemmatimonadota bacterium]